MLCGESAASAKECGRLGDAWMGNERRKGKRMFGVSWRSTHEVVSGCQALETSRGAGDDAGARGSWDQLGSTREDRTCEKQVGKTWKQPPTTK